MFYHFFNFLSLNLSQLVRDLILSQIFFPNLHFFSSEWNKIMQHEIYINQNEMSWFSNLIYYNVQEQSHLDWLFNHILIDSLVIFATKYILIWSISKQLCLEGCDISNGFPFYFFKFSQVNHTYTTFTIYLFILGHQKIFFRDIVIRVA